MTGTVRKWMDKGFGFIMPTGGGDDVFVHNSAFGGGSLAEGQTVQFTMSPDPRNGKLRAENVSGPGVIPNPGGQPQGGMKGFGNRGGASKDATLIGQTIVGTVRQWLEDKGYGFLEPSGQGGSIFCHNSAFGGGSLPEGAQVQFSVVADPRSGKPRAENVMQLGNNAAAMGMAGMAGMMPGMQGMMGAGAGGMGAMGAMGAMGGQAGAQDPMAAQMQQMQQMMLMQQMMAAQGMMGGGGMPGMQGQMGQMPIPGMSGGMAGQWPAGGGGAQ